MYLFQYKKDSYNFRNVFNLAVSNDWKKLLRPNSKDNIVDCSYTLLEVDSWREVVVNGYDFLCLLYNDEIFGSSSVFDARLITSWSRRAYELNSLICEVPELHTVTGRLGNKVLKETDDFRTELMYKMNSLGYVNPDFRMIRHDYMASDILKRHSLIMIDCDYAVTSIKFNFTNVVDCILNNINQFEIRDNKLYFPRYVGKTRVILVYTFDTKLLVDLM